MCPCSEECGCLAKFAFKEQRCQHVARRAGPHPRFSVQKSPGNQVSGCTVRYRQKCKYQRKSSNKKKDKNTLVSAFYRIHATKTKADAGPAASVANTAG